MFISFTCVPGKRNTLLIAVLAAVLSSPASYAQHPTSIPGLARPEAEESVSKMVSIFRAEEPRIPSVVERVLEVQREIHRNPEIAFQEHETRDLLMGEHARNGAQVHKIGATGFVAIYEDRAPVPAGVRRPAIAVRGELDAIFGRERTDLPWASAKEIRHPRSGRQVPIFHGCGHDLHSAYLVGVGEMLARHLDRFPGTFLAIGQPAEENLRGMRRMLADGLFDAIEPTELWGIHLLIRRLEGELQIPHGTIQGARVDPELSVFANDLLKNSLPEGTVLYSDRRIGARDDFWVLTDPRANGGRDIPGLLFFSVQIQPVTCRSINTMNATGSTTMDRYRNLVSKHFGIRWWLEPSSLPRSSRDCSPKSVGLIHPCLIGLKFRATHCRGPVTL